MANYGYGGGYSTTTYGAQGGADGGGFMGGSQQGSQEGSGNKVDSLHLHASANFVNGSRHMGKTLYDRSQSSRFLKRM